MLAPDATLYGDGGGKAPAIRTAARRCAPRREGAHRLAPDDAAAGRDVPGRQPSTASPGVVYYWPDGRVAGVQELEIADGVVVAVRAIANPDKLAHLAAR